MAAAKPTPQQSKAPVRPPAARPEPSTGEVIKRSDNTAVATQDDVPDYIKKGVGRGNENVDMSDVVMPRIEIAQALSPCLKKSAPEYIPNIEQGMLYNTVTRRIYGPVVPVVPVFFRKEYLGWKSRKAGGGFCGAYPTRAECQDRISTEDKPEEWEATETAQQLVLVVNPDGTSEEAVISMNKTKMKVSKNWNSLIRLNGNDRFSRQYNLFTVDETNSRGEDYKNFGVMNANFPPLEVYKRAEALYTAITSGARKVVIDHGDEGDDSVVDSGEY